MRAGKDGGTNGPATSSTRRKASARRRPRSCSRFRSRPVLVLRFCDGWRSVGPSVLIDGRRQAGPQDAAVLRLEILQTERTGPTGRLQSSTARTVTAGAATTLYAVAGRSADANLCDAGFVQDPSKGQAANSLAD